MRKIEHRVIEAHNAKEFEEKLDKAVAEGFYLQVTQHTCHAYDFEQHGKHIANAVFYTAVMQRIVSNQELRGPITP